MTIEETVRKRFDQLTNAVVVEGRSQSSYNDAGTDHWHVWVVDGDYYQTHFNTWDPDEVTIEVVAPKVKVVVTWVKM